MKKKCEKKNVKKKKREKKKREKKRETRSKCLLLLLNDLNSSRNDLISIVFRQQRNP